MPTVLNLQVSNGAGLPSGSNSSLNAVAVTGANDFGFVNGPQEPYIGGGTPGLVLAAATTGTVNSDVQYNRQANGIIVVVDITAITAGSLTVKIQGLDPASLKWYDILTSTALAAVATTVLRVFPGATAVANLTVNDRLPFQYRVSYTVATGPVTATIGAIITI